MTPGLKTRRAGPVDLGWINERYAAANFLPSDPTHTVLIIERTGARAGIGRLVPVQPGVYELGGILVDEAHRGQGVARAVIAALLDAAGGDRVYCIPYADLRELYTRCGFAPVAATGPIPEAVRSKLEWCRGHYARPVVLMQNGGREAAP